MTATQIEKLKDEINTKYYGDECLLPENLKMPITKEDETLLEELECREMINSCLVYGDDPFEETEKWWYMHGYCKRSYMSDYEDTLGKERVRELYEEQKESLSKATIHHNVYTDNEGLTYNSVDW